MSEKGVLQALRALLDAGALDFADVRRLLTDMEAGRLIPSHREFVRHVREMCPEPSRSTYDTGFKRLVDRFGDRLITNVTVDDLAAAGKEVRVEGSLNPRAKKGLCAERNFLQASRFFYERARAAGFLTTNFAKDVPLPAPDVGLRRALDRAELTDILRVAESSGDDPQLDSLLVRTDRVLGCRLRGLIGIREEDLDFRRPSVILHEKNGVELEVPCGDLILAELVAHMAERPADHSYVFRYRNGQRVGRRRFNYLFGRIQDQLPWAERLGISLHWIRHTTLTDIANATTERIAQAYGGHSPNSGPTIRRYTKPSFDDLSAAYELVFGPLRANTEMQTDPAVIMEATG